MPKLTFILLSIFLFSPLARGDSGFSNKFEEIIPLCEKHFLPNSMAQLPETDIEARALKVDTQIKQMSNYFNSPAGLAYLNDRLKIEQDDVAKACIRLIIEDQND